MWTCVLTGSGWAFFDGVWTRGGGSGGRAAGRAGGHGGRCRTGGLDGLGAEDVGSAGSGAGGGLGRPVLGSGGLAWIGPDNHGGSGSRVCGGLGGLCGLGGGVRPEVSGGSGEYSGSR